MDTRPTDRPGLTARSASPSGTGSLEALLMERQAALRLLYAQISVVLWATDRELTFTSSTGSGLSVLGLEENEVVGMTLLEYFHTDDDTFGPIEAAYQALEGEVVAFDVEWAGRRFRAMVEPLFDGDGAIVGTHGVAVDETAQVDLESQVRMLTAEVESLRRAERDRRAATLGEDPGPAVSLTVGDLVIQPENYIVRRGDEEISLTPIEFRLLVELARNADRVLSRAELLEKVWGYDFLGGAAVVNMAIRRLREKVEHDPHQPQLIQTVRGVGYRATPSRQ